MNTVKMYMERNKKSAKQDISIVFLGSVLDPKKIS